MDVDGGGREGLRWEMAAFILLLVNRPSNFTSNPASDIPLTDEKCPQLVIL